MVGEGALRARLQYAERGFEYDAFEDHYECPQGERLARHAVQPENALAVYRAPASSCNACPLKTSCTPHDEGRHLYRSLAAWTETDIGRFHRRISMLLIAIGAVFSLGGLTFWIGKPGTGLLALAVVISFSCIALDLRAAWVGPQTDLDAAD